MFCDRSYGSLPIPGAKAAALSVPDCSTPRGCRAPQSPLVCRVVIITHLQRVGLETIDRLDLGWRGGAFKPRC